jgi:hypothetical protein
MSGNVCRMLFEVENEVGLSDKYYDVEIEVRVRQTL